MKKKPNIAQDTLDRLEKEIIIQEPHLKERIWPPMSYMIIPSMLNSADKIISELEDYCKNNNSKKAKNLLAKIKHLRDDFRREA